MCAIPRKRLNLWDNLGGPTPASYFCHLLSIATLNLIRFSSLSSSLLFPSFLFFLFHSKLNLPKQCSCAFQSLFYTHQQKVNPGTPPNDCQEALKKELEIDSSPNSSPSLSHRGDHVTNIMNKNAQMQSDEGRRRTKWRAHHECWEHRCLSAARVEKSTDIKLYRNKGCNQVSSDDITGVTIFDLGYWSLTNKKLAGLQIRYANCKLTNIISLTFKRLVIMVLASATEMLNVTFFV